MRASRSSSILRVALSIVLMVGALALSSGCYPVLQCRGGKALVEASRLKAVPSFDWPVFAYNRRKPPKSKLAELDRVVVLPFYSDVGEDYELLGIYSVPSKGGRITYPLRIRVAWARWTAFGLYEPEERPDLGAFVFAPGCLPMMLDGLGGGNNAVHIPDEDHPENPRRPPAGFQARITCILIPEAAAKQEPTRSLSRAGALPLDQCPPLLTALGRDNLGRFTDLLKKSKDLSEAERQAVRQQLLRVCEQAMQEPDNKPYVDSFRELRQALAGI